jgi:sugar phosphate permease
LYLHRYAWGIVRPEIRKEYPWLTDVQLGWLDSLFNVAYAIGQVPGGMAGDRLGTGLVLPLLLIFWSVGLAGLGSANGFWQLAAWRAWFGLGQAGVYPNLSQVTRSWFPASVRTMVQGAVASLAGRAGGACASIIVATCLMGALGMSWRHALIALSAAGVALALVCWLFFRDRPGVHPWANEAERLLIEGDASAKTNVAKPTLDLRLGNLMTLGVLLLYSSASTFADQLYVFWLPQFLVEEKGMKMSQMGLFAGLPLWGGALGGALGGVLNDVLIRASGSKRFGRAAVALAGKGLAAVLIALSVGVADGRWVMVVLMVCKFFGDWSLASIWGATTDIGGPAAGTVFGVVNMAGSVAAFVASPVMGYLVQTQGWEVLFYTVAGVYALSAVCWLLIDSNRRLVTQAGT